MKKYLTDRFKEPTSYIGVALLVMAVFFPRQMSEAQAAASVLPTQAPSLVEGAMGVLAILLKEGAGSK